MFKIDIDDSQVVKFTRISPQRGRWAAAEALKMTGGHMRKKIRRFIEKGGEGWAPLHPVTEAGRKKKRSPLFLLGRLVRFKYSTYRGAQRVQVGFFPTRTLKKRARQKSGQKYSLRGAGKEQARFESSMGMTDAALARLHEYGKRRRVSARMRRKLGAMGLGLRKKTRALEIPPRPMIGPVFRKEHNAIPLYFERRFFQKFFCGEKPRLRI